MASSRRKSARRGPVGRSHDKSRDKHRGTIRLGLVLTALVGINLYVFLWRGGTSIPEVRQAAMAAERPAAMASKSEAESSAELPEGDESAAAALVAATSGGTKQWMEGVVGKGDSLGRIFRRQGFTPQQTDEVVRSLRPHMDFRAIRAGQTYRIRRGVSGGLDAFEFHMSKVKVIETRRGADGKLAGKKLEAATEVRVKAIRGTITSSLYGAMKATGEDTRLVAVIVDIFAYDLNFFIDQHKGDTFRMLVEKEYLGDEFLGYRRVLAAEYSGKAGTFRAFYWKSKSGKTKGYFTEDGRSIAKTFLKTPLKFSRVSSKFDRHRMHPVLHKRRAHLGVDYAAATGTPVWAAASGKIIARGRAGGAGNRVAIKHGNGYQTIYMHLSKFRKGQKVGSYVKQKTVIGYVGATGLATGAHLHFSLKKNGKYIDPMKMKMARGAGVPRGAKSDFKRAVAAMLAKMTPTSAAN